MHELRLRAGRSIGRTLYRVTNDGRDDDLVGVMDTRDLAAQVVAATTTLAEIRELIERWHIDPVAFPDGAAEVLDLIEEALGGEDSRG